MAGCFLPLRPDCKEAERGPARQERGVYALSLPTSFWGLPEFF